MKDHEIAIKINELRTVAVEYANGDYGRLRTMIVECVGDDLKKIQDLEIQLAIENRARQLRIEGCDSCEDEKYALGKAKAELGDRQ